MRRPGHVHADVPYALDLEPHYLQKPWGGRRVESLLGWKLPTGERAVSGPIGEAWVACDRVEASSVIRNGPLAGKSLTDVLDGERYPLLLKVLDATERLSLQVHPDREAAARLGAEAKTECWFVLHAEPGASIVRGLEMGKGRHDLEKAIGSGEMDGVLNEVPVSAGDVIFVPAGTIHSIGAGILLVELQENSDTTLRLYDWGRLGLDGEPRTLQIDDALAAAYFGPLGPDKVPPQHIEDEGTFERRLLIRTPLFTAETIVGSGTFTLCTVDLDRSDDHPPDLLHVLAGEANLIPYDREMPAVKLSPGSTVLLPARQEEYEIEAGAHVMRMILCRPPGAPVGPPRDAT